MKFTFNWLKEFVDVSLSPSDLAKMLTMAGLEVESLTPIREPESDAEDWLFEVGVTPNRGDCLSIAGIAREIAALTGSNLKSPALNEPSKDANIRKRISISIEDPQLCARYSARIVDEIKLAPSPVWMRNRLESCGIRAINNVVDITNYVMLETGQPLHAFDLERLTQKSIKVRAAGAVTKFTTLDGVERELSAEDVVICDGAEPVALAGIMGGMNSEVRVSTASVLLESANFAPAAIRRTARRLGLHSEASHRFERGVDPEGTITALNRAVYLLVQLGGGRAEGGVADRYPGRVRPPTIVLRDEHVERLLGLKIERSQAAKLLNSLGMQTKERPRRRSLTVVPPASRPDITREADVIEELARVHGYDQIPTTMPLLRNSGGKADARLSWERKLRFLLAGEGLNEVINLPFTSESLNEIFPGNRLDGTNAVTVLNPLAKENAEMRHSLIPGLIENLRFNLAFKTRSFQAYHLGKVFFASPDGEVREQSYIAGLLYGPRARHGLRVGDEKPAGFLECKGLVEAVLELFHIRDRVTWNRVEDGSLHPGLSAKLLYGESALGYMGEVHPNIVQQLELPSFFLFELDFEKLLEYAPRRITVRALPRFPAVERDVALVVDRDFASQRVVDWIKDLGEALIEHVDVFDQYLGAPVPEGKKSLAYKISYRAEDRTLTDAEINVLHQRLVERLGETFGAERRS
jgi:phenylalanyl-tRNA synthetase beta chain